MMQSRLRVVASPPCKEIYDFKGYYKVDEESPKEGLSLQHTVWANTVVASNCYILGLVVYTGKETRFRMNSQDPKNKIGKIDLEINRLTKYLFVIMLIMSLAMVSAARF